MAQARPAGGNPFSEIGLAIFVIVLVVILIVELPPFLISMAIAFNITLGVVLLMISL